jgi:transcriptional regulator with XRE-family HTH domain
MESKDILQLGEVLRKKRKGLSLSKDDVLRETGISYEYLFRLENGLIKNPSASVLYKLSEYYAIDLTPILEMGGVVVKREK